MTDLEEEKKKHSADQAVGEEVAYHLEKERDKLVLKVTLVSSHYSLIPNPIPYIYSIAHRLFFVSFLNYPAH